MTSVNKVTSFLQSRSRSFYWLVGGMTTSVLILFGSLNYLHRQTSKIYRDFMWVEHTYQVINGLDVIKKGISECESEARGYAISHHAELIEQYTQRKQNIHTQLEKLYELTHDNPQQHERVARLRELTRQRFAILDSTVNLAKQAAGIQVVTPLQATLTQKVTRGHHLTKAIGYAQEQLKKEENRLLDLRKQRSRNTLSRSIYFIVFSVFVGIVITVLIGIVIYKYINTHKQAAQQLEALNEQKKRFFSIIGHDLRGPIHSSITLLQLHEELKHTISEKEKKELYDAAVQSLQQTAQLLENLLTWGRAQLDRLIYDPKHISAAELGNRILTLLEPIAFEKEIQLINAIPAESLVYADAVMLELVVRNLVSNSLKFTLPDGKISLHFTETAAYSEIAIKDTGVGMSQEVIDKLFKIDSKFTLPGTKGERGTGLGLVLCQQYIQKHGGTIEIKSQPGKGSTFCIRMPRIKPPEPWVETAVSQEEPAYS